MLSTMTVCHLELIEPNKFFLLSEMLTTSSVSKMQILLGRVKPFNCLLILWKDQC